MNYFNYFTEIEDTFVRRRGKNLFLSPLDWAMMETWQDRGIPLHIVIRAVESVFDARERQPRPGRSIKSLFYCREEVEAQYAEWAAAQVGGTQTSLAGDGSFSAEAISAHIDSASQQLKQIDRSDINECILRAIARLEDLAATNLGEPETIDSSLADIEKMIETELLKNWDEDEMTVIRKELSTELREYKRDMSAESYANTFDLMLLKRLRETAGIPRLGLFYI